MPTIYRIHPGVGIARLGIVLPTTLAPPDWPELADPARPVPAAENGY